MKRMNINHLLNKIDHLNHKEKKCCFSTCTNKPINSHTLPENVLSKLNKDLTKIYTFQRNITPILNKLSPELLVPVDKYKFSTFKGFCEKHDNDLFHLIDEFDGVITKEKACLIHYRNICYGIHHIRTQQKRLTHVARQNYVDDEPNIRSEELLNRMRNGYYARRLSYCLNQHLLRKKQLEDIIKSSKFDQVDFTHLIGSGQDPIFCGRSTFILHKNQEFLKFDGYPFMPWITYMTLLANQRNYLIFCWLKKDKRFAAHLKYLCKKTAPRKVIEVLAYGYSDALAVDKVFYEKHSGIIENVRKHLGAY